eukprot:m.613600 g.613600  ORF g.613600 m.613600 type:complete len:488 (-) comp22504_c0_seq4:1837-3300(-)
MLRTGVKVRSETKFGRSAGRWASELSCCVQLLGCRVRRYKGVSGGHLNAVDDLGNTALYYAVLHESVDMVRNLLVDPDVDVNLLCSEGVSAFMLSTFVRPRGHLPIFFTFLDLAADRIIFHCAEDRRRKNDVRVDPDGKCNTVVDFALMEEFVYSERPMTWALRMLGAPDPTGLVLELLNMESRIEEARLDNYRMDAPPEGTLKYTMRFMPPETSSDVGEVRITIVSASGLHSDAGDWSTGSSTFCVVHMQHRGAVNEKPVLVQKTEAKSSAANPSFNAVLGFQLPKRLLSQYRVGIEVWCRAEVWGTRKFLGCVFVPSLSGVTEATSEFEAKLEAMPTSGTMRVGQSGEAAEKNDTSSDVPTWKTFLRSDGVLKQTWNAILQDECIPWDYKLLMKAQCMYDPEGIQSLRKERTRQYTALAQQMAKHALVAVAYGVGASVGFGLTTAYLASKGTQQVWSGSDVHEEGTMHSGKHTDTNCKMQCLLAL